MLSREQINEVLKDLDNKKIKEVLEKYEDISSEIENNAEIVEKLLEKIIEKLVDRARYKEIDESVIAYMINNVKENQTIWVPILEKIIDRSDSEAVSASIESIDDILGDIDFIIPEDLFKEEEEVVSERKFDKVGKLIEKVIEKSSDKGISTILNMIDTDIEEEVDTWAPILEKAIDKSSSEDVFEYMTKCRI